MDIGYMHTKIPHGILNHRFKIYNGNKNLQKEILLSIKCLKNVKLRWATLMPICNPSI